MKLLAISTSCWSVVNREFYRKLSLNGYDVKIVIPSVWNFGGKDLVAEVQTPDDPDIEFLEPTNFHHRLYRLKKIKSTILNFKPEVILPILRQFLFLLIDHRSHAIFLFKSRCKIRLARKTNGIHDFIDCFTRVVFKDMSSFF